MIQKAEDQAAIMMNTPTVRVVERAGTKIMDEIGDNNPWRKEWSCPRRDCLPCQGQALLGAEEEEETLKLVCGQGEMDQTLKKTKEDRRTLPGCTQEGCN